MKLPKFILKKDWSIEPEFSGTKSKIVIFSNNNRNRNVY